MIPARDEYFDHNYHLDNPQPPDFGHLRLKGVTWTGGDDDWMIALVDRMAQLRFVKMDIAQHTQFQSERWMITRADQNNKHLYNADDFIKRDNHNFDSRTPTSTAASFQAQEPLRSNSSGQVLTGIQEESKHRRMAELRRDVERVLSDLKSLYWSFGEPGPELADKLKKASSSLLETDGPWLDRIAEMRKRMKAMGSAPISDTDTAHLVTVGGRSKSDTDSHSRLKRKRVDWEAAEAEREALRKNIEDNTSRLLSKRAIFQADELFEGHRDLSHGDQSASHVAAWLNGIPPVGVFTPSEEFVSQLISRAIAKQASFTWGSGGGAVGLQGLTRHGANDGVRRSEW